MNKQFEPFTVPDINDNNIRRERNRLFNFKTENSFIVTEYFFTKINKQFCLNEIISYLINKFVRKFEKKMRK